jgi:hypothetical protein
MSLRDPRRPAWRRHVIVRDISLTCYGKATDWMVEHWGPDARHDPASTWEAWFELPGGRGGYWRHVRAFFEVDTADQLFELRLVEPWQDTDPGTM